MRAEKNKPTVDDYIAACPPEVQSILQRIRETIKKAAPSAEETISYQMPAYMLNGPLVYFGAFKKHIGFYPPVGDEKLRRKAAPYAGEKGNLRFPLDEPIPFDLISQIVKARVRENQQQAQAKKAKSQRK